MSDLADFLLARIAEDEAEAPTPSMPWDDGTCGDCGGRGADRVLAECEAKRRIVDAYLNEHAKARPRLPSLIPIDTPAGGALGWTLKCLALPYADHPDYRDEWRP